MFGDYDKFYQNIFAEQLQCRDRPRRARRGYNNRNDRKNLFSQTDLVWENRLGGIDQTLLLGFEVGGEKSRNKRLTGDLHQPGNACRSRDPTVDANVIFAPLASDADNRVKATSRRSMFRTRSGPPTGSRSSLAFASTASRSA